MTLLPTPPPVQNSTDLRKLKNIEIILSFFFDHSCTKIEINNKWKAGKSISMWKLNSTLLSNHESKKISKDKFFFFQKSDAESITVHATLYKIRTLLRNLH